MHDETPAGPIRPEPKNPPAPKAPERPAVASAAPAPAATPAVASLDDIARVVVAAQRAAMERVAPPSGKTVGLDETVEGGRYEVNGVFVDANGRVLPN